MRRKRLCRIDRNGCVFCGCREFQQTYVINDALASSWGLSARERAAFDRREGHACVHCGMSKRVRMLLWTIKHCLPSARGLRIVHFNQINQLGPALRELGEVTETCYQPGLERGARVGDRVNEDMCRLTLPDGQFDLAVHSETLEHLFDFKQALDEVRRILKPGRVQIYTVPLIQNRQTRQLLGQGLDGAILHHCLPSFHGSEGEFPVVWEFGGDFLKERGSRIQALYYDNYWTNKTVFAVVEKKN